MLALWQILARIGLGVADLQGFHRVALDGAIRAVAAIPVIVVLGIVIAQNGFKFTFSPKGSKKALFASAALFLLILATFARMLTHLAEADYDAGFILSYFATYLIFDPGNSIWEETLWRGLLMTLPLYYFGDKAGGRLAIVLLASFLFSLVHFTNGLSGIVVAFLAGVGLSAVYAYSGNLLIPIIVHPFMNIFARFGIEQVHGAAIWEIFSISQLTALVAIFVYGIIITIKAKPFSERFIF
ncbi:MAG: CPBP family intramembrane metalloprotease [Clostridiales bacterium]|jgi:membrane protease YdiL (CAAX protease family)|nr:CPBP family intramembrane metalloprotease [Clostridiales bacterium]